MMVTVFMRAYLFARSRFDVAKHRERFGAVETRRRAAPDLQCRDGVKRPRVRRRPHFLGISIERKPFRRTGGGNIDETGRQKSVRTLRRPLGAGGHLHRKNSSHRGTWKRTTCSHHSAMADHMIDIQVACVM